MTTKDIKAKLRRYQALRLELEQIQDRIWRIETALGPGSQGAAGGTHGSGVSDPTGNKGTALADLWRLYDRAADRLIRECRDVEEIIAGLDPTERRLARYRYLDGLTWEEVCEVMNYSWRQVHRIHSRIIETLAREL